MKDKVILLVEDNADDEALTRRALAKNNIQNTIVVAHDGVEALDCVFGTGSFKNDPVAPVVVLLDLKLPKIDGLEVLRRIRADARTRLLPVVILTSSKEPVRGGGATARALLAGLERATARRRRVVRGR